MLLVKGEDATHCECCLINVSFLIVSQKLREIEAANDDALLTGARLASSDTVDLEGVNTSEWVPVLVIVPPSVIDNWMKEFCTWGHFGVGKYQNQGRHQALAKVKNGTHEILVCGGKLATLDFNELSSVQWKLIIVDEVHAYKVRHCLLSANNTILLDTNSSTCLLVLCARMTSPRPTKA